MVIKSIIGVACACLLSITFTPAVASVIYTYTGNTFDTFSSPTSYDSSMFVTATIELEFALDNNLNNLAVAPLGFSISDGVNTITQDSTARSDFKFSTNAAGDITEWLISATDNPVFSTQSLAGDTLTLIESAIIGGLMLDHSITLHCTNDFNCTAFPMIQHFGSKVGSGQWLVTTVPIPSAVWLFGSGLIGLVGLARRKRQA